MQHFRPITSFLVDRKISADYKKMCLLCWGIKSMIRERVGAGSIPAVRSISADRFLRRPENIPERIKSSHEV